MAHSKMEIAFILLMAVAVIAEPVKGCTCAANYKPVCGRDGHTYSNACRASCSDVSVAHEGECQQRATTASSGSICGCPDNYEPVCGTNGRTYSNACAASCWGRVSVAHKGNCTERTTTTSSPEERCICIGAYRPVCGTDERTYSNECWARCRGVSVARKGNCRPRNATASPPKKRCICPVTEDKVCGSDGKTHNGACKAACKGVSVASQGKCGRKSTIASPRPRPTKSCICPIIYAPVCGTDGKTYGNSCEARCRKVDAVDGACEPKNTRRLTRPTRSSLNSCICNLMFAPVCGTDGRTYSNSCQAGCSGVSVAKQGRC